MRLVAILIVVLFVLFVAVCLLPAQEVKVTSVSPIVPTKVDINKAYVIGKDVKVRTCPDGFSVYVWREAKDNKDKNLYYVNPGVTISPQGVTTFNITCLKEEK